MVVGRVRELWRYPAKSMQGERVDACVVGVGGIPGDRGWALRDETSGEITGGKKLPRLMQCAARYRRDPTADEPVPPVDVTFPDGTTIGSDNSATAARLSELLGRPVSLWPLQPASNRAHYRRAQPGAAVMGWIGRTKGGRRLLQRLMSLGGMDADLRAELGRERDEPLPDLSVFSGELFEFTSPPGTYFDAFPIHLLTTASLAAMAQAAPAASWDVRRFRPNVVVETAPGVSGLVESGWRGRTVRLGAVRLHGELPTVRCSMTMAPQADLPKDPAILRAIVRDAEQNLGLYATVATAGDVRIGDDVVLE
jgi:uncharacterized protein YcbX